VPTKDLMNLDLQNQLQGILDQIGKEEAERYAARVKAEERISLNQKQSMRHVQEVHAWEEKKIYIREERGNKEQRVHCCRVGRMFLNVRVENGSEPVKIERAKLVSIRTPEERLLAILDSKIRSARRNAYQSLKATSVQCIRNSRRLKKEMESLDAFRSRIYRVLLRKGFLLDTPEV